MNVSNIILKHKPDWIINAGAYTNVDTAESKDLTLATNSNSLLALVKPKNYWW